MWHWCVIMCDWNSTSVTGTGVLPPPPPCPPPKPKKELLLGFKRIKWVCDNRGIKRGKDWIRKGPLGLKRATSRSRVQSPVVTTHSPPLHPFTTHFLLGSFVHSAAWVFIRNANAPSPDLRDVLKDVKDILEVTRKWFKIMNKQQFRFNCCLLY